MKGGKSQPTDNSAELYAVQQAELAREKAAQEEEERLRLETEAKRREELRAQMLGQRNVLATSDEEEAAVLKTQLG